MVVHFLNGEDRDDADEIKTAWRLANAVPLSGHVPGRAGRECQTDHHDQATCSPAKKVDPPEFSNRNCLTFVQFLFILSPW
jgi:hypothetical protein